MNKEILSRLWEKVKGPKKKGLIRETIETIVVALVLALIIRTFVIQVFYIPSGSMEPTLLIRDRLIVSKFIYRFRDPQRGEVIVFRYPSPNPKEPKRDFIKRIVGLPGQVLEVRKGFIYINGKRVEEDHPLRRDRAYYGPIEIPKDTYFVMGDNRGNSSDSRAWGFLPRKNIVGLAYLRFWPLNRVGIIP